MPAISCGIVRALPRIIQPLPFYNNPPCAQTQRVLLQAYMCLESLGQPTSVTPKQSDIQQFNNCLRAKGLVNCETVVTQPKLWVETLELMIGGTCEDFNRLYSEKMEKLNDAP